MVFWGTSTLRETQKPICIVFECLISYFPLNMVAWCWFIMLKLLFEVGVCVCVSHFQTPTWIDWYGTMGVWVNSVLIWLYMIIDRYIFPKLSKLRFVTHSFNNPFPPKKKHCPVSPWWNVGGWNHEWDKKGHGDVTNRVRMALHISWLVVWNMNFMTFHKFPYFENNHPNWLHTLWEFNIAIKNGHRNSEFSIVFPTTKWWIFP